MLVVSVFLYIGTGVLLYMNYKWFVQNKEGCSTLLILIVVSAAFIFLLTALTISPLVAQENKSIITSWAVSLYVAYLTWSALTNSSNMTCNTFSNVNSSLAIQIAIGTLIFTVALLYVSY